MIFFSLTYYSGMLVHRRNIRSLGGITILSQQQSQCQLAGENKEKQNQWNFTFAPAVKYKYFHMAAHLMKWSASKHIINLMSHICLRIRPI